MIRVAATADLHFGTRARGSLRPFLEELPDLADVLLIAGDLTMHGDTAEAAALAEEIAGIPIPIVSILGNHDYHRDEEKQIRDEMEAVGVRVLEGESTVVTIGDATLGVAGVKGFGGGFVGASGSDFGEPEMKAFIRHSRALADRLEEALGSLGADQRVALIHYAPVEATVIGERAPIYPFLGSHFLADAIDRAGADLVLHGHAHAGSRRGATPGGVPVRNVAQAVLGAPYALYGLGGLSRSAE